jgi:hypothetical protein
MRCAHPSHRGGDNARARVPPPSPRSVAALIYIAKWAPWVLLPSSAAGLLIAVAAGAALGAAALLALLVSAEPGPRAPRPLPPHTPRCCHHTLFIQPWADRARCRSASGSASSCAEAAAPHHRPLQVAAWLGLTKPASRAARGRQPEQRWAGKPAASSAAAAAAAGGGPSPESCQLVACCQAFSGTLWTVAADRWVGGRVRAASEGQARQWGTGPVQAGAPAAGPAEGKGERCAGHSGAGARWARPPPRGSPQPA